MAFMQPEVFKGRGYIVETEAGTEAIPMEVCGDLHIRGGHGPDSPRFDELCGKVDMYLEGRRIKCVEPTSGWWARLSAPGYLDCTAWSCYSTKRDALDSLRDM